MESLESELALAADMLEKAVFALEAQDHLCREGARAAIKRWRGRKEDTEFEKIIARAMVGENTVVVGRMKWAVIKAILAEFKVASRDGRIDAFTHDAIVKDTTSNVLARLKNS